MVLWWLRECGIETYVHTRSWNVRLQYKSGLWEHSVDFHPSVNAWCKNAQVTAGNDHFAPFFRTQLGEFVWVPHLMCVSGIVCLRNWTNWSNTVDFECSCRNMAREEYCGSKFMIRKTRIISTCKSSSGRVEIETWNREINMERNDWQSDKSKR